ncbi:MULTISPECIES: hypothetical protein [Methylosinus]|nr:MULTISPECIES: hypothetical protein [Methylosinus]
MIFLVTHFWVWWMAALAIGAATALLLARAPERGALAGWLAWFGLAVLAGLPVAALHLLSGRAGLWLETGLALFLAFLVGAALGALAGGRSLREHEGWAVGLLPLALIVVGANVVGGRSLEAELARRAVAAIETFGGDPARIVVEGRDLLLTRDASAAEAERKIAQIAGVRRLVVVEAPVSEAPRVATAEPSATDPAPAPAEAKKQPSAALRQAGPETSVSLDPGPNGQRGAESAATSSGILDAVSCQRAVATILTEYPIRFTRNAGIRRMSSGALEKISSLLQRCPAARVEVRAYGEAGNARAERVTEYLARMGVERGRLSATSSPENAEAPQGVEIVIGPRG